MRLYLVRHGKAEEGRNDDLRRLSARGRDDIRRLGEWCRRKGIDPAEIWHSPKVRARETATLLAGLIDCPGGAVEREGLLPEDDPGSVAELLDSAEGDLCIVSHLPFVGLLAGHLARDSMHLEFSTSSMWCALRAADGAWTTEWFVSPKSLEE